MLVDEELTRVIKGCFFSVQNEVGLGLPEEAYHQAMIEALKEQGLPFASKPLITVRHNGRVVIEFFPDFIVADRVILELKAIREEFAREHYVQLFSYLKATRVRLGFLVNFGCEWVRDKRLIFDEKPVAVEENWDAVRGGICGAERDLMALVRASLLRTADHHGLGHGEMIYRQIAHADLEQSGLSVIYGPTVTPKFKGEAIGGYSIGCLLVNSRIICLPLALKDGLSDFDKACARSYVTNMGLKYGVIANFGKTAVELLGIAGGRHR